MVRATRTSMRVKPNAERRTRNAEQKRDRSFRVPTSGFRIRSPCPIEPLAAVNDGHQVGHIRRLLLRQRDSIQRPLGPLDVGDQLADRMTPQPVVELTSLQE